MPTLTSSPAWKALAAHHSTIGKQTLSTLFKSDPKRAQRYSLEAAGLYLNYSRQLLTDESLALLLGLARQSKLEESIRSMFHGDRVNLTEDRPALHTALRQRSSKPILVDGQDVMPFVRQVLAQMEAFVDSILSGQWRGFNGKPITHVVNLGIGGSDAGPAMVTEALRPYAAGPEIRFVSNADSTHLIQALKDLEPESTLFVISSKSFTTQETMLNASSARQWLLNSGALESDIARHFVAVSTNLEAVKDFGIAPKNCFAFRDWVGGRYSLWSAIGLPIALGIGFKQFEELLEGAYLLDTHFQEAPLEDNLPVIMGLIGIWNVNFQKATNHALLPYDQSLVNWVTHCQQLIMESNGKSVDRQGKTVDYHTAPLIWGGVGTNGQHSFYQWLHQGTSPFSADFMAPLESPYPLGQHHQVLLANFLAQPEALMQGRSLEQARALCQATALSEPPEMEQMAAARVFAGNHPSNILLYPKLTPKTLGTLIALYEQITFVQSVIWNINPFDQWGVELGKEICSRILPQLSGAESQSATQDPTTQALLDRILKH